MNDDEDTDTPRTNIPVRNAVVKCRCGDSQIAGDGECPCGLRAPGAMPIKATPDELLAELTLRFDELSSRARNTPKWRVLRRLATCEARLDTLGRLISYYRHVQAQRDRETVPAGTEVVGDRG